MDKFANKKLLMLGSNTGAIDMLSYAKRNGAYVIVADWNPVDRSEAKRYADESLLVSTANLDALGRYIDENNIDGVLAGISEFNLLNAMTLAEEHDLPFYCTREQWEAVESKDQFRRLCMEHGVPCPEEFFSGSDLDAIPWETLRYPCVLKPVDACASKGVFFCGNEKALQTKVKEAAGESRTGRIIIEEFVSGFEFTAHYVVRSGKASLSCIDNRYPVAVNAGDVTTVPVARVYPSHFIVPYMQCVDSNMVDLCESVGMQNGVMFIQGLYDPDNDRFSIFEAGLRSAGEAPCRFLEKVNGVNYLHLLVDCALSANSDFETTMEDPFLDGKCCGIVSFVTKGGQVGAIQGLEEVAATVPSVIGHESRYPVGAMTPDGNTLRQLMIRFVMVCDSREQMASDIDRINTLVNVYDVDGNNMVIKMIPERVFGVK